MDVFSTRGKTPEQTEGQPSCPHVSPLSVGPQLGEDSFRRVVEWAPSAMVMIDRDGIMVLVNAQTEQMFNYEPRRP
jgi:PAS domain-containing protein